MRRLRYLTAADDEAAAGLADAHYRTATNMTDMIAGLAALTRMNSPLRDAAFAHFHDRFRNDPLVLDKWMSLQAGSPLPGTVAGVRALMKHPAFDIKNPNRVRALVGAFAGNHLRFHARGRRGYALVGETIRALDPSIRRWRPAWPAPSKTGGAMTTKRQALMRAEIGNRSPRCTGFPRTCSKSRRRCWGSALRADRRNANLCVMARKCGPPR